MENKNLSISEKVRMLFIADENGFRCTLSPNCKFAPKSLIITNCLRHVKEQHVQSYNVLQLGKQVSEEETDRDRGKKRSRSDDEYAYVRISKQRMMGGILKMFGIHGMAFHAMEWEGLQDIVQPLLEAFHMKLNEHNIVDHVKKTSEIIDSLIRQDVGDKMVSVKMDTTSKMNRSVMGVSIQYYNELKLERRSLGIVELHDKHTASYLKDNVEDLCAKFGIKRWQIYSATVDNGRNVVKAVDLMP